MTTDRTDNLRRKKLTVEERASLIAFLRKIAPPGSPVYTLLRGRNTFAVLVPQANITFDDAGNVLEITTAIASVDWHVARLLGRRLAEDGGVIAAEGSYVIVNDLASALYGDGDALVHRRL